MGHLEKLALEVDDVPESVHLDQKHGRFAAGMLTLNPRMDHLGRPGDPLTANSNLIRQPSAEDLDAAHQLVSSARGRQASIGDSDQRTRTLDSHPPFLDAGSVEQVADASSTNDLSGNICRCETAAISHQCAKSLTECSNCGTTNTPLWRRSPTGTIICNACGLYLKARHQSRPTKFKKPSSSAALAKTFSNRGPRSSQSPSAESSTSNNTRQPPNTYRPPEHSSGSCPGGGQCNGAGGSEACSGCPAFNNRVAKSTSIPARPDPSPRNTPESSTQGRDVQQTPIPDSERTPQPELETDAPEERGQLQSGTSLLVACQNCGTTVTPLWRRDEVGHPICNACGLYHKLHRSHRPTKMKKSTIKRRKRVMPASGELRQEPNAGLAVQHTTSSPEAPHIAPSLPVHLEQRPPQPRRQRQKNGIRDENQLGAAVAAAAAAENSQQKLPRPPPPPIDFTNFRPTSPPAMNGGQPQGRKRPSSTEFATQPSTDHLMDNNPNTPGSASTEVLQLDPSLRTSSMVETESAMAPTTTTTTETDRDREPHKVEERRMLLQKEIEGMRESLMMKERELKTLL